MIRVDSVGKSYGRVTVLDSLSCQVEPGELVLLLGDNGAGKTTLLRAILGIIDYRGSILVDGLDPLRDGKEVRSRVGYLPQSCGLALDVTVSETLEFYASLRGVARDAIAEQLEFVELEAAADAAVGELSVGMRQRLGFAVASLSDPPVLLLDEPTASLDARSRGLLSERVANLAANGRTILLSTHAEGPLRDVADRSLLLDAGRLAA